ncbi:MAG: hypothetical protein ISS18_11580 [Bacteroidales bacterium]|nr:hypothetical protein [Bacteroidales bacterium]
MIDNEIKNVIIFDGVREYTKDEIIKNSNLRTMMNGVMNLGGFASIIKKINDENGLLYITTDLNHQSGIGDLKNVSPELYFEYMEKVP